MDGIVRANDHSQACNDTAMREAAQSWAEITHAAGATC